MAFSFMYYYPDESNIEFTVTKVGSGNDFTFAFYEREGKETSSFVIDTDIVHDLNSNTNHEGKEADAIAKFRTYGQMKWPESFH